MNNDPSPLKPKEERELARRTRRSFGVLGASALAGLGGWLWLTADRDDDQDIPGPFRRAFALNQSIASRALFSNRHHAPEFPASSAQTLRANGDIGITSPLNEASWHLEVAEYGKRGVSRTLSLGDVQQLPKVEHTTEFKCIEGWSTIVHWGGARLSDFTEHFFPDSGKASYVGMQTPDEEYYVGLDMQSALHPQTLLCYEMNGKPLTPDHGAPLRLVIPVKYGIKNIKRIGRILYGNTPPRDYWAEQGYDYYSSL